jgi:hypothetical protein
MQLSVLVLAGGGGMVQTWRLKGFAHPSRGPATSKVYTDVASVRFAVMRVGVYVDVTSDQHRDARPNWPSG